LRQFKLGIQQTAVLAIFLRLLLMAWVLTFCHRDVIGGGILSRGVILLPERGSIGISMIRWCVCMLFDVSESKTAAPEYTFLD